MAPRIAAEAAAVSASAAANKYKIITFTINTAFLFDTTARRTVGTFTMREATTWDAMDVEDGAAEGTGMTFLANEMRTTAGEHSFITYVATASPLATTSSVLARVLRKWTRNSASTPALTSPARAARRA